MKLNFYKTLPPEFKTIELEKLHDLIGGPSLFHLKGQTEECIFISTLLHANETSGFLALQRMYDYITNNPKKSIILFIGNTFAAKEGQRHLDGQPDYNRIWKGGPTPEHHLAWQVKEYAREQKLFACVDVHNNTGKNPLYGCVNFLQESFIKLAGLFGSHIIYFTEPHNVLSNAFAQFCPSVTIEAGLPGEEEGIVNIEKYLKQVIELDSFSSIELNDEKEVFQSLARIIVGEGVTVDFENSDTSECDFSFIPNIDERNFTILPRNTHLGFVKDISKIKVIGNEGQDLTEDYLKRVNGELLTNRMFMPSMFTKNVKVLKSDCLGYVMEKVEPRFFLA